MRGLMMEMPLLISSLIRYAAEYHGGREIVTRTIEKDIHRTTYAEVYRRTQQLAHALTALGAEPGDRIGTIGWNSHRHLEVYYAVSGIGAILHTINPRLFADQLVYIMNHAEDRFLFVDSSFVPLIEQLADKLPKVEGIVVMAAEDRMPETTLANVHCHETLIAGRPEHYDWPRFDENTASSLCYTSGTTGNPKGVLYSHRSTVIHSWCVCSADTLGINNRDSLLVIVPMFHANAWGTPYAAAMCGAKLVFPGPHLDGQSVHELIESEGITASAAVPTVWLGILQYLEETGKTLDTLERVAIGGTAAPPVMVRTLQEAYGVRVCHAWGMTEMSPLGTTGVLKGESLMLPKEEQYKLQEKQGRGIYGVDLKIVDDDGEPLARDGVAFGNLMVRGPWISSGYFKGEGGDVLDPDGWFPTGDVATLDAEGYMQITDRAKDVIKSGGEWIGSIELENVAMEHPGVAECAVIGVKHPKWDERPLLLAVRRPGSNVTPAELLGFFAGKVAKWWLPDDVVFLDELPHTPTGKVLKTALRERFADHVLPTAGVAE
ncbi:MAG: 3-(methylthio)propionyl-CoA ligase [Alphaproteobacteria bacterium]|nr:3-(methylthio)propionyl-CoA ligase [Alphaproteobacteria bacterium]MDP6515761.1 3-(methylthio)propionyl-CoA ligase [Alphaproteobacteria bacterium]